MDSGGRAATEASRPATAEEEAIKRNTDCVYFLASPLTCKKGSECEYRHSEGARVNPRDCWYWLNGECLNPKCNFRHPPLESLFGVPEAKTGSAQPPYATFQVAYGPSAYSMNKQNVPCYYFQKGHCLKGDKCPFMHGSSTAGNNHPQHAATISSPLSDPTSTNNKEKLVKECTSQQSLPRESANKSEMASLSAKPVVIQSEPNNGSVIVQNASPYLLQYEHPPFELNSVPHSWSENLESPSVAEHLQTGREVDEFLGESSPGFDVLVDDHVEDPDYFQNEEEYGQAAVQGGRNLKALDDFDYQHSDYEHVSRFERENFTEGRGYERYGRSHDPYGREELRISSERRLERSLTPEKRKFDTNRVGESDLRHRLKQRRLNSRRPAVSPDRHTNHSRVNQHLHEQRTRVGHSNREYRSVQKEGFVGSRLQGRISLPVRSEVEINRERNQNRSSIGRTINYKGRQHERIKNRQTEDMNYGVRKYNGQTNRRVEVDAVDFVGPKSLAELKCAKVSEASQDQKELGSRDYQDSEVSLSFEGPKPLSVILKKKKDTTYVNGSCNNDGGNLKDSEGHIGLPYDGHKQHAFESTEGGNTVINPEAPRVAEVDDEEEGGMIQEENEELLYGEEFSEKGDMNEVDGVIVDSLDYHGTDNYDQGDGEFDYEEANGGKFKPEDEVYQEDAEEDDEDDFTKKAGFMLS